MRHQRNSEHVDLVVRTIAARKRRLRFCGLLFDYRPAQDIRYAVYVFVCIDIDRNRRVKKRIDDKRTVVIDEQADFGGCIYANIKVFTQNLAENVQHADGQVIEIAEVVGYGDDIQPSF